MAPADRDTELSSLLDELHRRRDSGTFDPEGVRTSHPDLGDEVLGLFETERALESAAQDWRGLLPAETASIVGANVETGAEATHGDDTSDEDGEPLPDSLGRYRVIRRLGRGGMGSVYEALDPQLDRHVAIKVPFFPGSPDRQRRARQRFVRESRAAALIEHANVCQVYDAGEDADRPYVVMAYVPGESLADRLKRGRFDDAREAVGLIASTADALAAVHAHGIIHRDIKPGNILLQSAPNSTFHIPKLTDFGLARREEDREALTADGTLVGTPAYMAPEQAGADLGPVSPRSDIYSLGAVLYEMLCGRRPYEGTVTQILSQVVTMPVEPLRTRRPDIDSALEAVVARAMARVPRERFAHASEFAADLRNWLAGQPTTTREVSPTPMTQKSRRPWVPIAAVLCLAAFAIVGVPAIGIALLAYRWQSGPVQSGPIVSESVSLGASNAPIPPRVGPHKGDITVWVWKRENREPDPNNPGKLRYSGAKLELRDKGVLPLRPDDGLEIRAGLRNGPGYMYLVWLNTEGKIEPMFPWDENWKRDAKLDVPRQEVVLPRDVNPGSDVAPLGGGPRGIESLILFVRDEPLPVGAEDTIRSHFAGLPAQNGLVLGSAVWMENGDVATRDGPERSRPKLDQLTTVNDPVLRTQNLLHDKLRTLFPYSRAVCFSNEGDK